MNRFLCGTRGRRFQHGLASRAPENGKYSLKLKTSKQNPDNQLIQAKFLVDYLVLLPQGVPRKSLSSR